MNLNEALSIFADDLDIIKDMLVEGLRYDVAALGQPTYIDIPRMLFECKFTEVDDLYEMYKYGNFINSIREEVHRLELEELTAPRLRAIKRIVMRQQHTVNKQRHPHRKQAGVTEDEIESAKEHPIEELFDGTLKNGGAGRKKGVCPFHNEKTGSFYIFPDNRYKCFGCQEHGDSIAFYMKQHNTDFIQAVKALSK